MTEAVVQHTGFIILQWGIDEYTVFEQALLELLTDRHSPGLKCAVFRGSQVLQVAQITRAQIVQDLYLKVVILHVTGEEALSAIRYLV